jgi:uncharacterized membrane protein YfcA
LSLVQYAEVFFIAGLAGIFGSMLGLGGGIILVPALITLLEVEPRTAVAASIVSVIATSSAGAVAFVRQGYANIELAVLLESTTTIGALTGTFVALWVSGEGVAGLFSVMLLYAAYTIVRPPSAGPASGTEAARIAGSFFDQVTKTRVEYGVVRTKLGLAAGFFAGNVSALLGVGGGLVMVPIMTAYMGVPLRAATATSNFMIGVTAVATAIPYYAFGEVKPELAAPCAMGVLLGARLGSRLVQTTRLPYIRAAFAAVLIYTAFTMARRAGLL